MEKVEECKVNMYLKWVVMVKVNKISCRLPSTNTTWTILRIRTTERCKRSQPKDEHKASYPLT